MVGGGLGAGSLGGDFLVEEGRLELVGEELYSRLILPIKNEIGY